MTPEPCQSLMESLKADPEFRRNLAEVEFIHSLDWTPEQMLRYNARLSDLAIRDFRWILSRHWRQSES